MMITRNLRSAFDRVMTSPQKQPSKKKARQDESDEENSSKMTGFTESDRLFLKEILGGFAGDVEQNFQAVNERQDRTEAIVTEVQDKQGLADKEIVTLKREVAELKANLHLALEATNKLKSDCEAAATNGPLPSGSKQQTSPQLLYVLGCLGRDVPREELLVFGKKIMYESGCDSPFDIWAPYAFGSQLFMIWPSESMAQKNKILIRQAQKKVSGEKYNVWMDRKKTRDELLPGKIVGAVYSGLVAHWEALPQKPEIVLCKSSKRVYINRKVVGSVPYGRAEWNWTEEITRHIDDATAKNIKDAAERQC